jgi:hypothetical protein
MASEIYVLCLIYVFTVRIVSLPGELGDLHTRSKHESQDEGPRILSSGFWSIAPDSCLSSYLYDMSHVASIVVRDASFPPCYSQEVTHVSFL